MYISDPEIKGMVKMIATKYITKNLLKSMQIKLGPRDYSFNQKAAKDRSIDDHDAL